MCLCLTPTAGQSACGPRCLRGRVFQYKDTLAGQDVTIKRVQLTNLPEHKRSLTAKYIPSE